MPRNRDGTHPISLDGDMPMTVSQSYNITGSFATFFNHHITDRSTVLGAVDCKAEYEILTATERLSL